MICSKCRGVPKETIEERLRSWIIAETVFHPDLMTNNSYTIMLPHHDFTELEKELALTGDNYKNIDSVSGMCGIKECNLPEQTIYGPISTLITTLLWRVNRASYTVVEDPFTYLASARLMPTACWVQYVIGAPCHPETYLDLRYSAPKKPLLPLFEAAVLKAVDIFQLPGVEIEDEDLIVRVSPQDFDEMFQDSKDSPPYKVLLSDLVPIFFYGVTKKTIYGDVHAKLPKISSCPTISCVDLHFRDTIYRVVRDANTPPGTIEARFFHCWTAHVIGEDCSHGKCVVTLDIWSS